MAAPTFDDVRRICLALPEAEEVYVEAWGHPTFRVRNKMFASMGGEDGERSCTFKTEAEERESLDAAGEPWFVPAYVAPVTSNSVAFSVGGDLARRTTVSGAALYTRGTVGNASVSGDDIGTDSVSVMVRHGLTDNAGLFAQVFYVKSSFAAGFSPLGTSLSDVGRTGVRVGASFGKQIAGRRRN